MAIERPEYTNDGGGGSTDAVKVIGSFKLDSSATSSSPKYFESDEVAVFTTPVSNQTLLHKARVYYYRNNYNYYVNKIELYFRWKTTPWVDTYSIYFSNGQMQYNSSTASMKHSFNMHGYILRYKDITTSYNIGDPPIYYEPSFSINAENGTTAVIKSNNNLVLEVKDGFGNVSQTAKINYLFSLVASNTKFTYTFNGNGGSISGQSTFSGAYGSTFTVPSASRAGKSSGVSYTVSFDANGGTISGSSSVTCSGATTTTSYNLVNYKSSNGGGTLNAGSSASLRGTYSFDAQWNSDTSTSGTCTLPSVPSATRFGYIFNKWVRKDKQSIDVTRGMTVDGNFTALAKWTAVKYKVSFNLNNNSSPVFLSGEVIKNNEKTFNTAVSFNTKNLPVAFGYKFLGWGTQSKCIYKYENGAFSKQFDDQIAKDTQNLTSITLYAHWETIKDSITVHYYDLNNVEQKPVYKYDITSKTYMVPAPKEFANSNRAFFGFYKSDDATEANKPWGSINKPRTKSGTVFWGDLNTSFATFGDGNYAYGVFKNPDHIKLTNGSILASVGITVEKDKEKYLSEWRKLKDQTSNDKYNEINSKKGAWGWEWSFYSIYTISGKYVVTGLDGDGKPIWSKVNSAYVFVENEKGVGEWKFITDLRICKTLNTSGNPVDWYQEVTK